MPGTAALRDSLDLLHSAKKGDQVAYETFMARYFDKVLRIVRARLGVKLRGRQESMDIAQDAMIRVIQGMEKFEPRSEGALIQWVSKLVENQIRDAADYHGAQKRRISQEVPIGAGAEEPYRLSRIADLSQKTPSQILALKEQLEQLERTLDRLGERKEVILLRNYAGMSFKEIGEELNISEDAARMQFIRAMDKLTDLLADEDEGTQPKNL
jgi:RNA polymerase sigma-70 factor (ECF subfamily)